MNNVTIQKIIAILLVCLASHNFVCAQDIVKNSDESDYDRFGKEYVYLHYNTSLLLVGEYLYYNAYVLNAENKTPTEVSKIAYVALLGKDGSIIFKQKVRLEQGIGNGDFFIPVSVPSGNYKLVGYTKWMTNWEESLFFAGDVTIINPYTNDQKVFRPATEDDTLRTFENTPTAENLETTGNNTPVDFQILLEKLKFDKREKVEVELKGMGKAFYGDYSISVRKRWDVVTTPRLTSEDRVFGKSAPMAELRDGSVLALPELRGEMLSGSITSKNKNVVVGNQKISFSIPGEEYELKILTTDTNGRFSFSLDKEYIGEEGVFQVLADNPSDFSIQMQDQFSPDAEQFDFGNFQLDPKMEEIIVNRSIYNQIENAYFKAKPDTLKIAPTRLPFYGTPEISYNLDDYTRFRTVRETLVEVIDNVWMTTNKAGKSLLHVRDLYTSDLQTAYKTLVLVDGFLLQDIDPLLNFDSRKIKSIRLLRNKYVFGSFVFQGIVDIETFENDFYDFVNVSHATEILLFKPVPVKNYFKQEYSLNDTSLENVPDYRVQLLWMPQIKLQTNSLEIDFFTSDITGNFEILIEGFSKDGKPVSLKKTFVVE